MCHSSVSSLYIYYKIRHTLLCTSKTLYTFFPLLEHYNHIKILNCYMILLFVVMEPPTSYIKAKISMEKPVFLHILKLGSTGN